VTITRAPSTRRLAPSAEHGRREERIHPDHHGGRGGHGGSIKRIEHFLPVLSVLRGEGGYTFVELLVVSTIVLILASAIMPLARVTSTRIRESELHRALRELRTAIDKYKDAADLGNIGPLEIKVGSEGYPPDLQILVDGVPAANDATGRKLKFLRKIPVDPMTRSTDWGLRSYQDKPDATRWGGQNVFDVYTTYDGKALDGTKFRDW
jgi:general secretion pathway protein G